MISLPLLLYSLFCAGAWLLVVSVIFELIERKLHLTHGIPEEMLESTSWVWWGVNFLMETMFYVAIPTIAYAFFYFSLPFEGTRAGMAAVLYAFTIGAAPALMGLSVRVKLPMSFVLFLLLSYLVKIGGTLIIIAYLYSL